jgi:formiminoglutamase
LNIYDSVYIKSLLRKRTQETKLGERAQTLSLKKGESFQESLRNNSSRYVLIGLPEDIGVRANLGRPGAYSAWHPALTNLLNLQSNTFLNGDELLVLGHVDFSELTEKADLLDTHTAEGLTEIRKLVSVIHGIVCGVVKKIIAAGKEVIVIGGGHNNSYPNIKAAAEALYETKQISSKHINCINCDAHADFRPLEGRHSGNGFSYAFEEKLLNKYSIIGLHENYIPDPVLKNLNSKKDRIIYSTFEDLFIREIKTFKEELIASVEFTKDTFIGLELDLDAVQNIPASAKSPNGISANQARSFINLVAGKARIAYLHIAEGAPVLSHIKADNKTGKLIANLVADFIKARTKFNKEKIQEQI